MTKKGNKTDATSVKHGKSLALTRKKELVSGMLCRGMSDYEILHALDTQHGVTIKICSVRKIITEFIAQGEQVFNQNFMAMKSKHLQELRHLKKELWKIEDHRTIIKCLEHEAKLLGLEEPIKIARQNSIDISSLSIDEQKQFVELVKKVQDKNIADM